MVTALGIVDWNSVSNAATAIGNAAQGAAGAYTAINNAINIPGQNSSVQTYLNPPQAPNTPLTQKDNTLMYVAVGSLGLILVGGIVYAATRK